MTMRNFSPSMACLALAGMLAVCGSPARAQDTGAYASVGVAHATSDANALGDFKEDSGQIQLRLGYAVNRHVAIEAEGSLAAFKPELTSSADGIRLTLDRYAAAFAVARLPMSDRVTIHGRGGYYASTVALEVTGQRETEDFDDLAYGLGASYRWNRNAIRADYTVLKDAIGEGGGPEMNHRLLGFAFVRSF